MSDAHIIDGNERLTDEAKNALLKAIIEFAQVAPSRVEEAARAYALAVGASRGVLPVGPLSVSADGNNWQLQP